MAVTPLPKKPPTPHATSPPPKKKQVVEDGVMLRCIRAAVKSLLLGPLKHNGISTSDGEPLQCQEGRQAFKSRRLFHFLPPPAKCGTVVLSGISTPGTILLGSVAAPPAQEGGRWRKGGRGRKRERLAG